jgi:hypothetical protein
MSETNAAAWAWVLSHAQLIRGIAFRHAYNSSLHGDDFHSALLLRCAEKWGEYDPEKGAPSTWVWNQARAVKSLMIDQECRNNHQDIVLVVDDDKGAASRALIASVEVAMARKASTPDEWEAACARAVGLSEQELEDSLGVVPFSVRRRVARLRKRLGGSHE